MPCYRPLLMTDAGTINPETGKRVMNFHGRLKDASWMNDYDSEFRDRAYIVPCNRCIGCRLDYARDWSNRMLLELADNPNALFITLTYDNDHVPKSDKGYLSTSVRDCQLFMKRLRKHFSGKKIRYFIGAEYGPKTNRPHYHGIFFGLTFDDFPDLMLHKVNKLGQPLYRSDILAKDIWKNGFCSIGAVSKDTCAYTARYMLKKFKGFDRLHYVDKGIEPEFSLCSRRPGIGLGYLEKHPEVSVRLSVFDGSETTTFPIPKKLLNKVLEIDPDQYEVLKALRRESASSSMVLEWQRTDMDYLEYLGMKETQAYDRIKGVSSQTRLDI